MPTRSTLKDTRLSVGTKKRKEYTHKPESAISYTFFNILFTNTDRDRHRNKQTDKQIDGFHHTASSKIIIEMIHI